MIRLDRLAKRYPDGTTAVEELTLDIADGELAVLVGPSGCGKTTTMKMVNRLIEPSSGRVFLAGEDVTKADPVALRRRIGYVIQQVGLFPHQTINANVATVPSLLGWDRRRTAARVAELLELVGLDPGQYGGRYPHQLSGGQRQRVVVARRALNGASARWAVVRDAAGTLHGWIGVEQAVGDGVVADRAHRMEAWVPADASLKTAFSVMLQYDAGWVAVLDGDHYLGVLTPGSLHAGLRRSVESRESGIC